ncbi:putative GTP-binding protein 6 [Centruroides vittatus]|uniref:putative GTP-binding protein 6 n=1 Tax=Centruroides vittatus TaxID=120091 RepID=UPI00350F9D63
MWKQFSKLLYRTKSNYVIINQINKSFQFCTCLSIFKSDIHKIRRVFSCLHFKRNISNSLVLYKDEDADLYEYLIDDSVDITKDEQDEFELNRVFILPKIRPLFGHNVFVIQPRIKWGPKKKWNTTSELQLAEAVTLAETIPDWIVVEKIILNCINLDKKFLFGSGNLKKLKEITYRKPTVSAVFISTYMLTVLQRKSLEKEFQLPVYDRYTVVLHIFQDHARTKQAKLQIALAEIPYLRSRIRDSEDVQIGFGRRSKGHISGSGGESFMEIQRNLLKRREQKIVAALDKLKRQRDLLRKNRLTKELPTVAVVGYTNCGKTSLIKALTGDVKLEPKDQLFATLDVTTHAGRLYSFQKILYVDTIGFISDIPTTLIESFAATLEDMVLSDVIVHVRDISHPDQIAQKENVLNMLRDLNLPSSLLDSIIEVGNKVDLLKSSEREKDLLYISATRFDGLDILKKMIEDKLMENTGRFVKVFRVPSGGMEMRWLYKEANVKATIADTTDPNFLLMEVVISQAVLSKYIHNFGNSAINQ